MRTVFTMIAVGSLLLLISCADTIAFSSTQQSTDVTRSSAPPLTVINPIVTHSLIPSSTIIPTLTWTSTPTSLATTPSEPTQIPSSGNPPQITSFTAKKTQGNSVSFTWEAVGIKADICPLLDAETLSYDCKGFFSYVGYETQIVGSEIWPPDQIGAPYTGFKLSVEGSNGIVETAEVAISGLSCSQNWFFGNPTKRCPTSSVTSLATAQHFEYGQMIWIKKLDKFYIFYDSGLQAWPTNLDIVGPLTLKSNASVDHRTGETPLPGYIEPVGNFGLIWRGEIEDREDIRERLGWAKEPEISFETVYQCSVGADPLGCPPNYLQDSEGKILNLYYVMHFGYYWQEQFNWETYSNAEYSYSIKYPDFLVHSMDTYEEVDGIVAIDKWLASDQSYAIYIFSYEDGVNPALEFKAKVTSDETIQVAGLKVRKLVGAGLSSDETGSLIHIGPVNHQGKNQMLILSTSKVAIPDSLAIFDQMIMTFAITN